MNSRQRIVEAIHHREAERVSVGVGGSITSGIPIDAYAQLRNLRASMSGGGFAFSPARRRQPSPDDASLMEMRQFSGNE
ncbi:MAG: hypothetical protein P4L75_01215 [Clostridia bacterium]|nr:hypothetical protein [Clostridia bacterium]